MTRAVGATDEVRFVFSAERVLVITALASLPAEDVKTLGFNVIERPVTIGQNVAVARAQLSRTTAEQSPPAMSSSRDE